MTRMAPRSPAATRSNELPKPRASWGSDTPGMHVDGSIIIVDSASLSIRQRDDRHNGSKQESKKARKANPPGLAPRGIQPWRNSEDDDMAITLDVQDVSEDG
ncbi:MAG: hypothetical protein LQ339_008058 [Xanthoria mediterranea]|nr:MAG: hypothetical protein LQ339_008058 [Xanthoria mediterranea]